MISQVHAAACSALGWSITAVASRTEERAIERASALGAAPTAIRRARRLPRGRHDHRVHAAGAARRRRDLPARRGMGRRLGEAVVCHARRGRRPGRSERAAGAAAALRREHGLRTRRRSDAATRSRPRPADVDRGARPARTTPVGCLHDTRHGVVGRCSISVRTRWRSCS